MSLPSSGGPPVTVATEESVVARIRAGDEAAFNELYLTYHTPLWKFAYGYVRSAEVAQELVQDVFLSVWARRADWEVRTRPNAWLYGAVRNRALNHMRHDRVALRAFDRSTPEAAMASTMGTPEPDVHDLVEAAEVEQSAEAALSSLSDRCRLALTLRWKHDLTPGEIAQVLGATPGSVRVLLTRGRQELARVLGRSSTG